MKNKYILILFLGLVFVEGLRASEDAEKRFQVIEKSRVFYQAQFEKSLANQLDLENKINKTEKKIEEIEKQQKSLSHRIQSKSEQEKLVLEEIEKSINGLKQTDQKSKKFLNCIKDSYLSNAEDYFQACEVNYRSKFLKDHKDELSKWQKALIPSLATLEQDLKQMNKDLSTQVKNLEEEKKIKV